MNSQRLNIGIWLNMPEPKVGGGFNYALDILLEIDRYNFDPSLNFIFLSFPPYNEPFTKFVKNKEVYRVPSDELPDAEKKSLPVRILNRMKREFIRPETKVAQTATISNEPKWRALKERGIHLLFYPVQHQVLFDDYPFVSNNWDLGHYSTHSFPELASAYEYEHRDRWYKNVFSKAFAIFAESEVGKKELVDFLNINPEKIRILPHFYTSGAFNTEDFNQDEFLAKHKLQKRKFFFYPAQFWAHKNHYNLLVGFAEFLKTNAALHSEYKLVFTGSDQGNLDYIKSLIEVYGLIEQVKYLGFVSKEEIASLYNNATALTFASFLGPSNLPLIEAMYHNCPVLCSDLKGHKELCGDAAMYFNAEIPSEIAHSMLAITDQSEADKIKSAAQSKVASGVFSAQNAMEILEENFLALKPIRLTWK